MEEFSDIVKELGLAYLLGIERKPNETDEEFEARVQSAYSKLTEQFD